MRPKWRRGPDVAGVPASYWTWTPYEGVTASVTEIDHVLDGPGRWWGNVDVRFWATMRPHNRCWPRGRTSFARRRDAQDWCRRVVELFLTHERERFEKMKSRAESAEATVARLAKVVRAAEEYQDRGWKHSGSFESFVAVRDAYDAALSSLTAEDRRLAGIEP